MNYCLWSLNGLKCNQKYLANIIPNDTDKRVKNRENKSLLSELAIGFWLGSWLAIMFSFVLQLSVLQQ